MSILRPTVVVSQAYYLEQDLGVMESLVFFDPMDTEDSTKTLLQLCALRLRAVKNENGNWIGIVRSNRGYQIHEFPEIKYERACMDMLIDWLSSCFEVKFYHLNNVPNKRT